MRVLQYWITICALYHLFVFSALPDHTQNGFVRQRDATECNSPVDFLGPFQTYRGKLAHQDVKILYTLVRSLNCSPRSTLSQQLRMRLEEELFVRALTEDKKQWAKIIVEINDVEDLKFRKSMSAVLSDTADAYRYSEEHGTPLEFGNWSPEFVQRLATIIETTVNPIDKQSFSNIFSKSSLDPALNALFGPNNWANLKKRLSK